MFDLGQDIHPLSDFRRRTTELIDRLKGTGRPIVLTLNGRPEIVVQHAAAYQSLLNRLEELESRHHTQNQSE
jgi:prevent-host-death family protein